VSTPVDSDDVEIIFIRSAGPGGQNVNKVATAAQLRFSIARYRGLDAAAKERLRTLGGRRVTDTDDILLVARSHRTQEGNRRDALARLNELIDAARLVPKPRRATRPTRASKERRITTTVRAGRTKQMRGRPRGDD
jgi:ribosome-associated protein